MIKLISALVLAGVLTSCSSIVPALNPLASKGVELNAQVGKENEQNKVKVESNSTVTAQTVDTINQADPVLMVLLALGFGLAIPSPTIWLSHKREVKYLKERILYEQRQREEAINLTWCSSRRPDSTTTSN